MKVSIVLPTRNAEWGLSHSLKHITNQSIPPNEIIICIGKSTDDTERIVLDLQKECKIPIEVCYDNEGVGTGYAMKELLDRARGDIILWADSDSAWSYWRVETAIRHFERDPSLTYFCGKQHELNASEIATEHPDTGNETPNITYYKSRLLDPSGLIGFKREAILKVGNFDPYFSRGQDRDMIIRLMASGAVGGVEDECQGYHFGVRGKRNLLKAIKTPTFFKFLYKYGFRYCLIDTHHLIGVCLRTLFLLSLILSIAMAFFSPRYAVEALAGVLLSIFGFVIGIALSYKRVNLNLLILQFVGSIGEYYQLARILKDKNKPKFEYGKGLLRG